MSQATDSRTDIPAYAWLVFALTFGLLISDYMARQVLSALFPLLKVEWHLTDSQLGLLSGIVAVAVGALTFPISLLADRFGRVRSIAVMATVWSIATVLCAVAQSYGQMLALRLLVGVGEAAYGSVGIAVIISVFPARLRATLTGAFMAAGLAGQVLGVGIGGAVAAAHGWRLAFLAIGLGGLVLAVAYPLVVRDCRLQGGNRRAPAQLTFLNLRTLFSARPLNCAYIASGLQLFIAAAIPAWLPTYFVRYYSLPLSGAASRAALFLGIGGVGMIICGAISDRFVKTSVGKSLLSGFYCISCSSLIMIAFTLAPGPAQLGFLALGMFLAAASAGPAGAIVASLTPEALHGTAFAVLTLSNNALGLAPGPIAAGWMADRIGLLGALEWLPLMSIFAAAIFLFGAQSRCQEMRVIEPA